MKKTIGGDRLGAGKKLTADTKSYGFSLNNLSKQIKMSMAPGVLYPVHSRKITQSGVFEVDPMIMLKTLPTERPLMDSYKVQLDVFFAEDRLYNAELHNVPLDVGLHPENIKFPVMRYTVSNPVGIPLGWTGEINRTQVSETALTRLLGRKGFGYSMWPDTGVGNDTMRVEVPAKKMLMYYEVFKQFYSNKQEENAYVIATEVGVGSVNVTGGMYWPWEGGGVVSLQKTKISDGGSDYVVLSQEPWVDGSEQNYRMDVFASEGGSVNIFGQGLDWQNLEFYNWGSPETGSTPGWSRGVWPPNNAMAGPIAGESLTLNVQPGWTGWSAFGIRIKLTASQSERIKLMPFPLKNIDDMRRKVLSGAEGTAVVVADAEGATSDNMLPYAANTQKQSIKLADGSVKSVSSCVGAMVGLCVKTYQSDRFNNWLRTDYIEGTGSIADLTKINVEAGTFTLDQLILAKKLYEMYNDIVVSGNTYTNYLEGAYGRANDGNSEMPVFCGGVSMELGFREVVSSAAVETGDINQPLGTLGGRASEFEKLSRIKVVAKSPGTMMVIVSLTPRLTYSQGNDWEERNYTMEDDHRPALDEIGFQDLLTDEMAAGATRNVEDANGICRPVYDSVGKQPAWTEYTTEVDEAHGTFALYPGDMGLTLNRKYVYEPIVNTAGDTVVGWELADATTYIDPSKYNYAFAQSDLEAQNFWALIGLKIKAKILKSNRVMPRL